MAPFFVALISIKQAKMRIAIISDIHEDFEMLEKAFLSISAIGYDLLVCLGDITGFSKSFYSHKPDANACLDLLRDNADIMVAGNHDLYSIQKLPSYHHDKNMPPCWYDLTLKQKQDISNGSLWLYEDEVKPSLFEENQDLLKNLEEINVLDIGSRKVLFSHFLFPDFLGITRWFPSRVSEMKQHFSSMQQHDCSISFVGHYHPDSLAIVNKHSWSPSIISSVKLGYKSQIVLCPAIVRGRGKPNGFIIYDTDVNEIVPFCLKRYV